MVDIWIKNDLSWLKSMGIWVKQVLDRVGFVFWSQLETGTPFHEAFPSLSRQVRLEAGSLGPHKSPENIENL